MHQGGPPGDGVARRRPRAHRSGRRACGRRHGRPGGRTPRGSRLAPAAWTAARPAPRTGRARRAPPRAPPTPATGPRSPPRRPEPVASDLELGLDQDEHLAARSVDPARASSTSVKEMKDRSATTMPGGSPTLVGSRSRTLTPSSTVTRSSVATSGASWPWPTSTATTCRAPDSRSTWVNPPVEAPASRQRAPETGRGVPSAARSPRAPSSLCAPRETHSRSRSTTTSSASATGCAGLNSGIPPTRTRPSFTSSAARRRDRARPRRTSSASSLVTCRARSADR